MKDFVKYASVVLAGYLIGVYKTRCELAMVIADKRQEELNKKDSEEKTEEEA